MWRVELSKEFRIYKFTDKFVEDILLWASRNPNLQTHDEIFKSEICIKLYALVNHSRYGNVLKNHMISLSRCANIRKVYSTFRIFRRRYREILCGKTRLPQILPNKTTEEIKGAFEYFYNSLLDSEFFWKTYNSGSTFKTKQQVRTIHGQYRVCPYCDKTNIHSSYMSNMDHFLPVSKFPFLSVHWENIVVSCVNCNNLLIKSANWCLPILHPYFDSIEDVVHFSFDKFNCSIYLNSYNKHINTKKYKIRSENLINLLKYNTLYQGMWPEVNDERWILEQAIQNYYHKNKGLLDRHSITTIFELGVMYRQNTLKQNAGKQLCSKLRWDYGEEYKRNERDELIAWLLNEQKELLNNK